MLNLDRLYHGTGRERCQAIRISNRVQLGIGANQPLRPDVVEIHLNPGVRTLALQV